VLATPPPPGGGQLLTSCCASAACACFQVTSCVLLKVRVYLSCWAWSDFPTGGGAPGLFVLLHPCLRILLAIYSEATACMRQLMCTAVSQIRSARPTPSSCTFHLPCMSIFLIYAYFSCIESQYGTCSPACMLQIPLLHACHKRGCEKQRNMVIECTEAAWDSAVVPGLSKCIRKVVKVCDLTGIQLAVTLSHVQCD
jgi:hypothetical protein